MRVLLLFCLVILAKAQETPDPYSTGVSLTSAPGCGVFILSSVPGSPADRAGLRSGDRVAAINGTRIVGFPQAVRLLQSNLPDPVTITVLRGEDQELAVISTREKRSVIFARVGKKLVQGGMLVPQDTTPAELERDSAFDRTRKAGQVFRPTHHPADPDVYYPGFELFVLRNPAQVMVGGIEDGPGLRAGVHYGDIVLSVNGVEVTGKTPAELEAIFSSPQPTVLHLTIDRLGKRRVFTFTLAKASEVARQNQRRLLPPDGLAPLGVREQDLQCFSR